MGDINIPEFMFNPYKLDNDALNELFSDAGGIIPSQVILLTGKPGSGKTTFAGYVGSHISDFVINNKKAKERPHGRVVFISREMSEFQMKLLSTKVANFDDIILVKNTASIKDYKEWMVKIAEMSPSLIILDSIQQLAREMSGSPLKNEEIIINQFKNIARDTHTPVILIGHVTKSGIFKGSNSQQHDVDTHIHIELDKETKERVIKLEKNRFGNISKQATMRFNDNCISIHGDFLNSAEDSTLEEKIEYFHTFNRTRKSISQSSVEILFNALLNFVKDKYRDKLEAVHKNPESLRIFFTQGKKSYTDVAKNTIYIGFNELRLYNDNTASIFDDENSYMNQICSTKEDKIIWMFFHEFGQLIYGTNRDTIFFQKIFKNLAKDNIEFFSTKNK